MKTDLYGEKTFEEFYCFEIPKENDVDISAFSLSNRVVHALVKNEIFTLVSLVKLRIKDFEQIRNLGKSSIEEVHTFVGSIAKDGVLCRKRENAEAKLTVSCAVYANLENILSGPSSAIWPMRSENGG